MPLKDIFKKIGIKKNDKKKEEKAKEPDVKVKKDQKEKTSLKKENIETKRKTSGFYPFVLKAPYITEKSTDLAEKNQYMFKVFSKVNKNEIKKAVEAIYNVNVLNVNIINVPKKKRRLGRHSGWKQGYKKAIIKIKKGQKIDLTQK